MMLRITREAPSTPSLRVRGPCVSVRLNIYGFHAALRGWPEVVEQVRRDFAWFESPERDLSEQPVEAVIVAEKGDPDYSRFGPLPASFVTPRNVVYQHGQSTVIDYFGEAISVFDRRARRLVVRGRNVDLVHEAIYHFVLSQASAALEARGLVRLHSLALVGKDGAVAIMLPSGGGKSTLALRGLQDKGVRLLSEDSPLMDRRGRLYPFPLRIAVNVGDAESLPAGQTRLLQRMEFHPKLALDVEAFAHRVAEGSVQASHLVIGRRTLGTEATIERVARREALGALLREAVVGVGLYQGMEFVLQHGPRDVFGQVRPGAIRAACCAGLLRRVAVWRLTLARDPGRNWRALQPLLGTDPEDRPPPDGRLWR